MLEILQRRDFDRLNVFQSSIAGRCSATYFTTSGALLTASGKTVEDAVHRLADILTATPCIEVRRERTYWEHPESSSVFAIDPFNPLPTDGLVHEIDRETYDRLNDPFGGLLE